MCFPSLGHFQAFDQDSDEFVLLDEHADVRLWIFGNLGKQLRKLSVTRGGQRFLSGIRARCGAKEWIPCKLGHSELSRLIQRLGVFLFPQVIDNSNEMEPARPLLKEVTDVVDNFATTIEFARKPNEKT